MPPRFHTSMPLTISFPASVMRRRGAATMAASTICPPMAGYPGEISGVLKMRVEPGEEFLHRTGPHQGFPEPPDGRLVRRPLAVIEAEETAKAAPVHDLQRRLRIRQTVERLDTVRHDELLDPMLVPERLLYRPDALTPLALSVLA